MSLTFRTSVFKIRVVICEYAKFITLRTNFLSKVVLHEITYNVTEQLVLTALAYIEALSQLMAFVSNFVVFTSIL